MYYHLSGKFGQSTILIKELFRSISQWQLLPKYSVAAILIIVPLSACSQSTDESNRLSNREQLSEERPPQEQAIKTQPAFKLSLVSSTPHSNTHFTQGLFFSEGQLYESIGNYGQSALIKYNKDGSDISVQRKVDDTYFAEGATHHNNSIYQLTWKAGKAFVYKGAMLSMVDGFNYEGEGWGLTSDGENLWLSDGSDQIDILNIDETGEASVIRTTPIIYKGLALDRLNELEWVNGWLLANRWYDNRIFVINPETGVAEIAFNLEQVAIRELQQNPNHVLNGIAWNPETETLWITGKNWSQFFQMKFEHPVR